MTARTPPATTAGGRSRAAEVAELTPASLDGHWRRAVALATARSDGSPSVIPPRQTDSERRPTRFRAAGGATPARVGSRGSRRRRRAGDGATRGPLDVVRVAMARAQDGAGAAVGGGEPPKTGAERRTTVSERLKDGGEAADDGAKRRGRGEAAEDVERLETVAKRPKVLASR